MSLDCKEYIISGQKYKFVKISPGKYMMGSKNGLPIELPVHEKNIDYPIEVLETPVTQRLFSDVTGSNPSHYSGLDSPVENINWYDAIKFCENLSKIIGASVRLPTEAEWEYFCRAGTKSEYLYGTNPRLATDYAWFDINSNDATKSVKLKLPNQWDLYDVIGNVWEWCLDNYCASYELNEPKTKKKVIRGGSYDLDVYRLRSAYRSSEFPEVQSKKIGFRVVK